MPSNRSHDISPETVRQHGAEEVIQLRTRVVLWKEDFLRHAPPGGGPEWLFLVKEFHAEIDEWLYPYVRRLVETEHITPKEAADLMDFCYQQVLEVAEHLGITEETPEDVDSTKILPHIYK